MDLEGVHDWNIRHRYEVQIMEFGQVPKQVFKKPHPARTCSLIALEKALVNEGYCHFFTLLFFFFLLRTIILTVRETRVIAVLICFCFFWGGFFFLADTLRDYEFSYEWDWDSRLFQCYPCFQSHKSGVTDVAISKDSTIAYSVGKDTFFKMHNVDNYRQERSVTLSRMALSAVILLEDEITALIGCWDSSM